MSAPIPVTPDVLRWARETAGFSIEEVVQQLKRKRITADTILAWERGHESPTYPQLERLAYEIYKRPLALFFFPEPPREESPKQSFRTLPDYEIEHLPPRIRLLIRKAKVFQLNLAELHDGVNPAPRQIVRDLSFDSSIAAEEMGKAIRNYLDMDSSRQERWRSNDEALNEWRHVLAKNGIFVFKDDFQAEAFSGFCLYDAQFPIIYVNNNKPKTRQIFTLFHELAHLLFRTGGVDTRLDDYLDYLDGGERRIEILCNRFAGEFLVSNQTIFQQLENLPINEASILKLANKYHVSREVILRKIFDRELVDQAYYDQMVRKWAEESPERGKGGNYYYNMGAYLDRQYLEVAFSRYYQNRISTEQLADYLDVKVKSVPGMETLLYRRSAVG